MKIVIPRPTTDKQSPSPQKGKRTKQIPALIPSFKPHQFTSQLASRGSQRQIKRIRARSVRALKNELKDERNAKGADLQRKIDGERNTKVNGKKEEAKAAA